MASHCIYSHIITFAFINIHIIFPNKKLIPFFPPHQFYPEFSTPLQHLSSHSSEDGLSRTRKWQSKGRTWWHKRKYEPNEENAPSVDRQAWCSSNDHYFGDLRFILRTLTCKYRTSYMAAIWDTSQLCASNRGNSICFATNSAGGTFTIRHRSTPSCPHGCAIDCPCKGHTILRGVSIDIPYCWIINWSWWYERWRNQGREREPSYPRE